MQDVFAISTKLINEISDITCDCHLSLTSHALILLMHAIFLYNYEWFDSHMEHKIKMYKKTLEVLFFCRIVEGGEKRALTDDE